MNGMDSKYVGEALRQYDELLARIEQAMRTGPYLAGQTYSIADIAVVPYVVRLDMLRLGAMWDKHPGVANWYRRMRERASVERGIFYRFGQCDLAAFANFEPDPWPKAQQMLLQGQ
jgi:glutathione S-transferase